MKTYYLIKDSAINDYVKANNRCSFYHNNEWHDIISDELLTEHELEKYGYFNYFIPSDLIKVQAKPEDVYFCLGARFAIKVYYINEKYAYTPKEMRLHFKKSIREVQKDMLAFEIKKGTSCAQYLKDIYDKQRDKTKINQQFIIYTKNLWNETYNEMIFYGRRM